MIHLVIFSAHALFLTLAVGVLYLHCSDIWHGGDDIIVPITLEGPAAEHYEDGRLVAHVSKVNR